jgi:O-antigen ligase
MPRLGIAMGFVVAHFFLFCNVLRMSRALELMWAGLFIVLAGFTILTGSPTWVVTLAVSFVATVILAIVEMRKPSYHGVFWKRINPGLPNWWQDFAQ